MDESFGASCKVNFGPPRYAKFEDDFYLGKECFVIEIEKMMPMGKSELSI
jgi:hypothetical protein